jgi:hypothetical protein
MKVGVDGLVLVKKGLPDDCGNGNNAFSNEVLDFG